jgi:hypothetical protein
MSAAGNLELPPENPNSRYGRDGTKLPRSYPLFSASGSICKYT